MRNALVNLKHMEKNYKEKLKFSYTYLKKKPDLLQNETTKMAKVLTTNTIRYSYPLNI